MHYRYTIDAPLHLQTLDQLNAENLGKLCAEIEAFW